MHNLYAQCLQGDTVGVYRMWITTEFVVNLGTEGEVRGVQILMKEVYN